MNFLDLYYVVQTNPQRENFVGERLSSLNPYVPQFKNLKGRIAPLFPGYIFVPAMPNWACICNTAGVRQLLMAGEHPAYLAAKVIAKWKAKERGGLVQLPPPPRFREGERLTILRGSLKHRSVVYAGMSGKDRERVLIEMLGQHVTILVATADLVAEFRPTPRRRFCLPSRRDTLSRQASGAYS